MPIKNKLLAGFERRRKVRIQTNSDMLGFVNHETVVIKFDDCDAIIKFDDVYPY